MRLVTLILFLICYSSFNALDKGSLFKEFNEIYNKSSDQEKIASSKEFRSHLIAFLQEADAMNIDFSEFMMFSKKEEKGRFRIFNWNVPLSNRNHYECVFAVAKAKGGVNLITCKSSTKDLSQLNNRSLSHKDWPAVLYYDIIPLSKKNDKEFVLLGWDGNDAITSRKVIEVISINEKNIRFGLNRFKDMDKPIKRYIIEYSSDATVGLNYEKKFKRLVFDHLSPTSPNLEGQYQFYVPDMSFDSFVFKKGDLYYRSDVKFRREKNDKDANFYDPRQ